MHIKKVLGENIIAQLKKGEGCFVIPKASKQKKIYLTVTGDSRFKMELYVINCIFPTEFCKRPKKEQGTTTAKAIVQATQLS